MRLFRFPRLLLLAALFPSTILASADVILTQGLPLIRQSVFSPPQSATFTLTNVGDAGTTIELRQTGSFFSQSPPSFSLGHGESRVVTVTAGNAVSALLPYEGYSLPVGSGVPPDMKIPVKILFSAVASIMGENEIRAERSRIEVSAFSWENPTGTARFVNSGDGNMAISVSDAPWLIAETILDLGDDTVGTLSFRIDRLQRPDSRSPRGSVTGSIFLSYQDQTGVKGGYKTFVSVVDTVKPTATAASLPALVSGQVALFVPGVGNVIGSGGKHFLSDVSILNAGSVATRDLRLYLVPGSGSTLSAPFTGVTSGQSLALADVVKSVFGVADQVGVLHVRGSDVPSLALSANVFNVSNPSGTFGTAIPIFRSDRAVAANDTLVITGLINDDYSHTNLYLQEAAGVATTARVDVASPSGAILSTSQHQIARFGFLRINDVVPPGGVTARVTALSGGKLVAYATPTDDASGDTWAVADWNRHLGADPSGTKIVPVAGAVPGANGTYFRTDLAVSNIGSGTAGASIVYYPQNGKSVEKRLTLEGGRTAVLADVLTTFMGVSPSTLGHLMITPDSGARLAVTSRTFTSVGVGMATYGTAIPTFPPSFAIRRGGPPRIIGSLEDCTAAAIVAAAPSTFRTNFGLVETEGQSATVRVSVRFPNGRDLAIGGSQGSLDYVLQPHQMVLVPRILSSILGDARDQVFGDMHNVQARFEVVSGNGAVIPFVTSTDNGTGDTLFRHE